MFTLSTRRRRCAVAFLLLTIPGVLFLVSASSPPAHAGTEATPTALLSRYSVFNQPAVAADALPTAATERLGFVSARRQPSGYTDVSHWATVRGDEVCVVVATAAGFEAPYIDGACNDAEYLETHHELLTERAYLGNSATPPAPGAANLIAGLAPDGVTDVSLSFADGSSAEVPVVDNGFVYRPSDGKVVAHVSWRTAAGATFEQ